MSSILGISAFYHDSAACILVNGKIVAAAHEERFTRKKHDPNYPHNAIEFVLKYANIKLSEVDQIVFLVIFGGLIVLTQGSAVAPFIYTIF